MKDRIQPKKLKIKPENNASAARFISFIGEADKGSKALGFQSPKACDCAYHQSPLFPQNPESASGGEADKARFKNFVSDQRKGFFSSEAQKQKPLTKVFDSVIGFATPQSAIEKFSSANKYAWNNFMLDYYKQKIVEENLSQKKSKLILREIEKQKKENLEKENKSFFKNPISPLQPYYQIQTCYYDNSHFARLMVLCSCNDHINCGVCRLKRIRRIQKKYLPALLEFKNSKMLTLTFKREKNESLEVSMKKFKKCLKRFKKTKEWNSHVENYFGSIEVVENNVHAHIVLDSKFWLQSDISDLWNKISGNPIVDIRKVNNPEKAIKEVFKYIVKDFKKELLEEVSELRKNNPHTRWIFSSKGLAKLGDSDESDCEAIDEAEVLSALEGEAESATSLDTKAISGHKGCPCCNAELVLVGNFENKSQAEAEMRRILAGNQYRNPKKT